MVVCAYVYVQALKDCGDFAALGRCLELRQTKFKFGLGGGELLCPVTDIKPVVISIRAWLSSGQAQYDPHP